MLVAAALVTPILGNLGMMTHTSATMVLGDVPHCGRRTNSVSTYQSGQRAYALKVLALA